MSDTIIVKEHRKKIIDESYQVLIRKEKENKTKSAAVSEIVRMIKKELSEDEA